MSFSFRDREESLRSISQKKFDLAVIGGGITGAAVARDASLRGLSVVLIEAQDFASGTSSGSTKLLHGGVRYLENFEFKLVRDAIAERELLSSLYAPHVKDLDFVFPTYTDRPPARWQLNLGLFLYDAFSRFRKKHKNINAKAISQKFPFLENKNLTGACIYSDSFAEDYRLVIELIKSAHRAGAQCLSRLKVVGFKPQKDFHFEISAEDQNSIPLVNKAESHLKLYANSIINCSGPFSDEVRALFGLSPRLKLTQGVHFLISRKILPLNEAFVLSEPQEHRILFAIPWEESCYLGTTDTSIENPLQAQAQERDLEYVLSNVNKFFRTKISKKDIYQSWAAVRPLIRPTHAESNAQISCEHFIEEYPQNVFHVLGGKLTSHRLMAQEAVDKLKSQRHLNECRTHKVPLHKESLSAEFSSRFPKLAERYGDQALEVLKIDEKRKLNRACLLPDHSTLEAELYYSIHEEMALEPIDFLRRRSSLYYHTDLENPLHREMIIKLHRVFAEEMGWNLDQEKCSLEKCLATYRWDRRAFS